MENNENITIVKSEKSNAPIICGIIGFVLEIPNIACNLLCAAATTAAAGVTAGLASKGERFDKALADKAADSTASTMSTVIMIGFLLSLLCFIFCFFGKKKCALVLGLLVILAALYVTISSCVFFSIFGLAAGILFLIQGITMMLNARKC